MYRRITQFGFRSLLVLLTIACVTLGLFVQRARRQKAAIEQLERSGAQIVYAYDEAQLPPPAPLWLREALGPQLFSDVSIVRFTDRDDERVTGALLEPLTRLASVRRVVIEGAATDEQLFVLSRVRGLQSVDICEFDDGGGQATVTRSGWQALAQVRGLKELQILNVDASDGALDQLAQCEQLTFLNLYGWKLKPGDAVHLRSLSNLQELNLNDSTATDEDLLALSGLPNLVTVHAARPGYSPAVYARVQKSLPNGKLTN